jgi:uncharacterized protein involved in outer membrane biogenesis
MKKLAVVGGIIVVVIIVVLVLGISNLGPIIEKAVNTYGPKITKTDVRLGKVDLSIFSGEAELKEFSLGNPKRFSMPKAIDVGSIYVDLDESSLAGSVVIIDKIAVVRPEITYEKAQGTDNFRAILANVKNTMGGGTTAETSAEKGGPGKKLMIREFVLEGGKVHLATSFLAGERISTSLPDIYLKDIGNEQEGLSPAAALEKVLSVVYAKIQSPAVMEQLNKGLEELQAGAKARANEELNAIQERAEDRVKTESEKVRKAMEDKVKGLLGN